MAGILILGIYGNGMRIAKTLTYLIFLVHAAAGAAFASPTGLIVIPTAQTHDPGVYELELQHNGIAGVPLNPDAIFLNTEYGIVNRVEAGVDFTLKSKTAATYFNWKYVFPVKGVRIGIGTYNVSSATTPIHYVVSSSQLGSLGVHLGAQRSNNQTEFIAGMNYNIKRLALEADYISGSENFTSAGFVYALSDQLFVTWGMLFPNDGSNTQFTLQLTYDNVFRRRR